MKMNFYCDESCHIRHDGNKVMVVGTIYCNQKYVKKINQDIYAIKEKYHFPKNFEIKWTKVSQLTLKMIQEIIKYVFDQPHILIRTIVIKNKNSLIFENHHQYDIWYYKILYQLIHVPVENTFNRTLYNGDEKLDKNITYNLFLDKKNTQSTANTKKLVEVLKNTYYGFFEFNYNICNSKDFPLIQIIDLFIGAIAYKCRKLSSSKNKVMLIKYIENLFSIYLNKSTTKSTRKFNNFIWSGRGVKNDMHE